MLVTLGGSDPDNLTLGLLKTLHGFAGLPLKVEVVVGPANQHWERISEFARGCAKEEFTLHRDPEKMPEIIAACDLCLCSGGVTLGEALYFNKPVIGFILAENQGKTVRLLAGRGVILSGGESDGASEKLEAILSRIAADRKILNTLVEKTEGLIDGRGKKRVGDALTRELRP